MKLSLAWIFDHIQSDWHAVDVPGLVDIFNRKTAEIEGFKKLEIDLSGLSLVSVKTTGKACISVESKELGTTFEMPHRDGVRPGDVYLVHQRKEQLRWATMADLGAEKEALLPAFWCEQKLLAGEWKKLVETCDWIFELDNKSVTHRPDMWGHRGFAREVAALLGLTLKPASDFVTKKTVHQEAKQALPTQGNPFKMIIENVGDCKRFAGLYVASAEQRPSALHMAFRLARIDARPINYVVDSTNYVMLDTSQPLHAFDAEKIVGHAIGPRRARLGEQIRLLDGSTARLTPDDLVIADAQKPLALAGVMGGAESAMGPDTRAFFVEAACFDAALVRKTAARHNVRTDASARFEKSLDPEQNVTGIQRLLHVWEKDAFPYQAADAIISLGTPAQKVVITLSHAFIQECLGADVTPDFIKRTLHALGFEVVAKNADVYQVTVPSFRASKDISIPEDIVEEIGRFLGYTSVPFTLPMRSTAPFELASLLRLRAIKRCLAYALRMHEVATYAMYDENWLREIAFDPTCTVDIKNPVAEQWRRMVTSLIPGLLKVVASNKDKHERMRFFECARTWRPAGEAQATERRSLAGVFVDQKQKVDFYTAKQELCTLFDALSIENVRWVRIDESRLPWYAPFQTACLMHGDVLIGVAGIVAKGFLKQVCEGDAFFFELDVDALLVCKGTCAPCRPAPKYPAIERDISVLVPAQATVDDLIVSIKNSDASIARVALVDFFEKEEWLGKRSLTFRCVLLDEQKTLTKEYADAVMTKVQEMFVRMGAVVR